MLTTTPAADAEGIAQRILIVRGQRALLDSDLAELYGVRTGRLNQQVRRNRRRFPHDFVFQLEINELRGNRLQFASGSKKHRDPRFRPLAFTLEALERDMATLDARTRKQFEEVYGAIRAPMRPLASTSRPIGFTADID